MNAIEQLCSWFAETSIRAALVAVAILALQAALRKTLSPAWRYSLWIPLILVLVVPVLPESRFSMERHFVIAASGESSPASEAAVEVTRKNQGAAVVQHSNPLAIFAMMWLGGVVLVSGVGIFCYIWTYRQIRRNRIVPDTETVAWFHEAVTFVGFRRAPELLISTAVESPAVIGLFRPTLLLPAGFSSNFSGREARLILLHELIHLKHLDLPVNWLLCGLQALHWFNPVLWFAFSRLRADREMVCDSRVLSMCVDDQRADYGNVLLKLESRSSETPSHVALVGVLRGGSSVGTRVRAIAAYRRRHPGWGVAGACSIAALTVVCATRAPALSAQREVIRIQVSFFDGPEAAFPLGEVEWPSGRETSIVELPPETLHNLVRKLNRTEGVRAVGQVTIDSLPDRRNSAQISGPKMMAGGGGTMATFGGLLEAEAKLKRDGAIELDARALVWKSEGEKIVLETNRKLSNGHGIVMLGSSPDTPERSAVAVLTVNRKPHVP